MKISIEDLKNIDLTGKTIAFQTDTVIGVGALPHDKEAIHKIYDLKDRDLSKPLAMLFSKKEDVLSYIDVDENTYEKMNLFWPGAVTFIVKKKDATIQPEFETIAIRNPNSRVAEAVLNQFGALLVTSLNKSGLIPVQTMEEMESFAVDYIVDAEEQSSQISSTVVDLLNRKILRKGEIDENILWETFPIMNQ